MAYSAAAISLKAVPSLYSKGYGLSQPIDTFIGISITLRQGTKTSIIDVNL
jgi:hypothetical protein